MVRRKRRRVIGFYTDKKGRVRPITTPIKRRVLKVHLKRSLIARRTDEALKAREAPSVEEWLKHPNRYDLPGVDMGEKTWSRKPKSVHGMRRLKLTLKQIDEADKFTFPFKEHGSIYMEYYDPNEKSKTPRMIRNFYVEKVRETKKAVLLRFTYYWSSKYGIGRLSSREYWLPKSIIEMRDDAVVIPRWKVHQISTAYSFISELRHATIAYKDDADYLKIYAPTRIIEK